MSDEKKELDLTRRPILRKNQMGEDGRCVFDTEGPGPGKRQGKGLGPGRGRRNRGRGRGSS